MQEAMEEQYDVENMENLDQVSFEARVVRFSTMESSLRTLHWTIQSPTNCILPPTYLFLSIAPTFTPIVLVPDG